MKNNIINIAVKQIESDDVNQIFSQDPFFKEFFEVFCDNKPFRENVAESIKNDFDMNRVVSLSDELISIFEKRTAALSQIEMKNEIGLIIFIGDGNIDGHSIIIDDSAYVFVDLKAIISRSDNLDIFLSHEIIHAVHYNLNKEFYPRNYSSKEDLYLKTLVVEGLATYMSMKLFGVPEDSAYWLGILQSDEINEWISNCEKMKASIGIKLKELIQNDEYDKSIYDRLFCIKKCEKLTLYRMGYYYGSEIIKNICKDKKINQVFRAGFADIKNYIYEYFFCSAFYN